MRRCSDRVACAGGWVMWDGRSVGPARGRGWSPWWCATRRSWAPHAQRHAWQPARQTKFTSMFVGTYLVSTFDIDMQLLVPNTEINRPLVPMVSNLCEEQIGKSIPARKFATIVQKDETLKASNVPVTPMVY
ncbi:unnamed protein product [Leptidea sinapis]|uniref:Uncharacterized protein n=1 Tax=Leptidea sinapis TaxID=189913 RepID=A0A5E4PSR2_9NEOP|nr:unnamed protein product [Leptidea sinapis]